MKVQKIFIFTLIFLGFWQSAAYSQDLNLFQAIENSAENQESARKPQRSQEASSGPAFTLKGTSRFGERYEVSLLARDGQSIRVAWKKNTAVEIKGYRGFSVVDVGARTATVDYPDNETCTENEEKGVRCNGSYALLSLSTGAPVEQTSTFVSQTEPIQTDAVSNEELGVDVETTEDGTRVFRNPFSGQLQELPQLTPEEQAARDERRARRAEQFRNFEIVRIADDEIPEGMQRIRTPFGDRLEPAGEVIED